MLHPHLLFHMSEVDYSVAHHPGALLRKADSTWLCCTQKVGSHPRPLTVSAHRTSLPLTKSSEDMHCREGKAPHMDRRQPPGVRAVLRFLLTTQSAVMHSYRNVCYVKVWAGGVAQSVRLYLCWQ